MTTRNSEIKNLLLDYFTQQKQLYGDGYSLSEQEFNDMITVLKNIDKAGTSNMNTETESCDASTAEDLDQLYHLMKACQKCPLEKTRTHLVFGDGNPNANLMLIGEAPGEDEDRQGKPFVGRAGQLLNKILEAINFSRDDVYITNILKCRPPRNRDPFMEEIEHCEPYLHQQIRIINPKLILALGRVAGQTILRTNKSLNALRGRCHDYQGIPMIITYHPAALLRNPDWKYPTWDDVQYLRQVFETIISGGTPEQVKFEKKN